MGVACAEDSSSGGVFSFPKNLSVWWSEETEYVLQRIERWAAYARGYNRLRSVRLSPGRMTMEEEPENRWSINRTTNKLVVENTWSPNFRQSRRQPSAAERARLRCCALGNFDYKSNGNLENNCLEAYSLDHSIYFKTIGDIRNEVNKTTTAKDDNNPEQQQQQQRSTPLDCGDFLSSDFDEDSDDEVDYEFREQLEAAFDESPGEDVIQVCRSVISEDEINNNFTTTGLPRKFASAALTAQQ